MPPGGGVLQQGFVSTVESEACFSPKLVPESPSRFLIACLLTRCLSDVSQGVCAIPGDYVNDQRRIPSLLHVL